MPTIYEDAKLKYVLPFEIKAVSGKEIIGHGSIFGNVDLGGDIVLPGAFKRSLAEHKANDTMPAMLWQHNSAQPIGVWHEFDEDDTGLLLKGEFANTTDGNDARTLAAMRAVRGLSIGFELLEFDFDKQGNRLLKEIALWETSIVTFPMNPKAAIEAVKAQFSDPRSFESYLREAGCSKKSARDLVHDVMGSGVKLDVSRCDADDDDEAILKELVEMRERVEADQLASHIRRLI